MELARQGSYRQLADEIGGVLQAAAETAEKMQEEARADAARIRAEAEAERRMTLAEGHRILDEARMEADMIRAEAQWQGQEIVAQAQRQAADRAAGAETRRAEAEQAQSRVLDRLAGVGQLLADTLATLREGAAEAAVAPAPIEPMPIPEDADDGPDADGPTAKVYFVEFPPAVSPAPTAAAAEAWPAAAASPAPMAAATAAAPAAYAEVEVEREIVLPAETLGASLFPADERSEWAPPPEMPAWWTRDGAQG